MRISGSTCTQLFEAAEAIGIRREELLEPLGLDARTLAASRNEMEWSTFAAVIEMLSTRVEGDPERLRAVGRAIVRVPSYAFFQRVARTLVSPKSLYELGRRRSSGCRRRRSSRAWSRRGRTTRPSSCRPRHHSSGERAVGSRRRSALAIGSKRSSSSAMSSRKGSTRYGGRRPSSRQCSIACPTW